MTSTGSDLCSRIRQKQETANQEIEKTTQRELKNFQGNLRSIVASELNTIKNATAAGTDKVRAEIETLVLAASTEIAKGREQVQTDLQQALEPDPGRTSAKVHALLLRRWGVSLVTGPTFCLGISIGSWGLMQWLSSEIENAFALREHLQTENNRLLLVQQRLEDQTWGLTLLEVDGKRIVQLPSGTRASRFFNLQGRLAFELLSD